MPSSLESNQFETQILEDGSGRCDSCWQYRPDCSIMCPAWLHLRLCRSCVRAIRSALKTANKEMDERERRIRQGRK